MKKRILPLYLVPFFMLPLAAISQNEKQIVHLDAMMQSTDATKASYTLSLTQISEYEYDGTILDYMNQIKASGGFVKVGKKFLEDGHFVYYHPNGKVESEGEFVKGIKVGYWKRYDANGQRKTDRYYPAESADKIRAMMQLERVEEATTEK